MTITKTKHVWHIVHITVVNINVLKTIILIKQIVAFSTTFVLICDGGKQHRIETSNSNQVKKTPIWKKIGMFDTLKIAEINPIVHQINTKFSKKVIKNRSTYTLIIQHQQKIWNTQ